MSPAASRRGFRGWRAAGLAAVAALALVACGSREPQTQGGPPTLRRLTEAQYRNIIADVFGTHIVVSGRFDPLVRTGGLLAVGAGRASITPSGLERFTALARSVAVQVVEPANRAWLVPCTPRSPQAADAACSRAFFAKVGPHLFRRPLEAAEVATYAALADAAAREKGDFHAGLAYGLQGMLVSPDFLFVVETGAADGDAGAPQRLDGYSRATRLSFFLWNSGPDPELLEAARRGDLDSRDGLEREVERMMASPRFEAGVRAFFTDMLALDDFSTLQKDTLIFPAFGLAAADDAREQVLRTLVGELVVRDGDYRDIFTTRRTVMSGPLGIVYRVPAPVPDGWGEFEFPEGDTRGGIQTQLSFVALHSHPGKSSPTLRGKAIRELLLCQKIPDPPGDVNFDQFNDPNSPNKTARNRLDAHSTDPACAGCHKLMDPIGLALETFDGAGQQRLTENGEPIDTSGEINGIPFADAVGLGQALRQDPASSSCVVNRAYAYAAARDIQRGEREWMTHLEGEFASDGYRLRGLFRRIATSDALYAIGTPSLKTARLGSGEPTS